MGLGKQAKILNEHQLQALLAWLDTRQHAERNRLIVLLSYKAGLRAKEIASLKWAMVMNADGEIGDHIHLTNEASVAISGLMRTDDSVSILTHAAAVSQSGQAGARIWRCHAFGGALVKLAGQ